MAIIIPTSQAHGEDRLSQVHLMAQQRAWRRAGRVSPGAGPSPPTLPPFSHVERPWARRLYFTGKHFLLIPFAQNGLLGCELVGQSWADHLWKTGMSRRQAGAQENISAANPGWVPWGRGYISQYRSPHLITLQKQSQIFLPTIYWRGPPPCFQY